MLKRYLPMVAILLVASFVTALYGHIALLGAVRILDVVEVWVGTHAYKETNYLFDYKAAFFGLGGIFGIVGLWMSGLFYVRLSTLFSKFNIVVIILLASGIAAAFADSLDMLINSLENGDGLRSFVYFQGPLLLVCCLSGYLIYRFMMPNYRLQSDAATPRA